MSHETRSLVEGTAHGIKKVGYKHEECIRLLILDPFMTQAKLAETFGVSQGWLSRVMSSDAFRARLAQAKEEAYGPAMSTVAEKLEELAHASLDRLKEKIEGPLGSLVKEETLIQVAKISTTALGYGARPAGESERPNVQFVVNLPGKAPTEADWASRHGGRVDQGEVIEMPGTPESA